MEIERPTAEQMLLNEKIAKNKDYDGLYFGVTKHQVINVMESFAALKVAEVEKRMPTDEEVDGLAYDYADSNADISKNPLYWRGLYEGYYVGVSSFLRLMKGEEE